MYKRTDTSFKKRTSSVRPEVVEALQHRARLGSGSQTLPEFGLPKSLGVTIYIDSFSIPCRIAWLYVLQVKILPWIIDFIGRIWFVLILVLLYYNLKKDTKMKTVSLKALLVYRVMSQTLHVYIRYLVISRGGWGVRGWNIPCSPSNSEQLCTPNIFVCRLYNNKFGR